MEFGSIAAIVSAILAIVGLYFVWRSQREAQLRRGEVLEWANESISVMQTLVLKLNPRSSDAVDPNQPDKEIANLAILASVLAERGRMFFKNTPHAHGADKPEAYRGLRPEILDQLIIAYQVALSSELANSETKRKLRYLAMQAEQRFVSLVQMEVGRGKGASPSAGQPGTAVDVNWLVQSIDTDKMVAWERGFDRVTRR
jgi:hypothetical protein